MSDLFWRRDVLGASEAPAVVGVDPFHTAGDVWAKKTGRVPTDDDDESSPVGPRALGQALEPLLLDAASKRLGVPLARQVWYRHPSLPLGVSVDGLALYGEPPTLVEAKTCGILNRPAQLLTAYGEAETDEVPESVLIQATHALVVLAAQPELPPIRDVLVVALLGDGRGLRFYALRFDPQLGEELVGAEVDFWRHVEDDTPPPYDPPSLATLGRWRRRADLTPVPVDEVLMYEWLTARAVKKQAEGNEETAKRFLVAQLGDAQVGESVYGRITYLPVTKKEHTVRATTYRQLRFHEPKEGVGA